MIMAGAKSFTTALILLSSLLASWFSVGQAQSSDVPLVNGLSWTFYKSTCPSVESIIRNQLKKVFKKDVGQAAGLLRLHFHDCFVQGCDGSILLAGPERTSPPNLSLRAEAFEIINDLRARIHKKCGRVVSCADILAIAARDSVFLTGGPDYEVPMGRRDGLTSATDETTLASLPAPFSNAETILSSFAALDFNATDVVGLSGAHTIGLSHCTSFTPRLYPDQDSTMDQTFANNLKKICPSSDSNNTTVMDIRSPNIFDNKYFVDLMNRQGLFTSDQDLYTNKKTRGIVTSFALYQSLFFEKFIISMTKMGQMSVLTGRQGEIRADCLVRNSNSNILASVVADEDQEASF